MAWAVICRDPFLELTSQDILKKKSQDSSKRTVPKESDPVSQFRQTSTNPLIDNSSIELDLDLIITAPIF